MRPVWLLLLSAGLFLDHGSRVSGQFLKYGTLSWRQTQADSTGITVEFRLHTAWNRSFFSRNSIATPWGGCRSCTGQGLTKSDCGSASAPCVLPLVGDTVEIYDYVDVSTAALPTVPTTFTFGGPPEHALTGKRDPANIPRFTPECRQLLSENGARCITARVVEAYPNATGSPMPEGDAFALVYLLSEFKYKYPYATASYTAGFQGCCRAAAGDRGLNTNPGGAWDIRTTVRVTADAVAMATGTASSPFFGHMPTVLVVKGRPLEFKVHAYDIPERTITYSIGSLDDHGVGLNQNSQPPYGNVMGIQIDPASGMVLFPATASTVYERFYNLVVIARVIGPCASYDTAQAPPVCLDEIGAVQTGTIRTAVDFYIQVVNTGYVGLWPATDCISVNAGMPPGSRVCNRLPVVTVPAGLQRFLCGEDNAFTVTAQDGDGTDQPSISSPKGAFALLHRLRMTLPSNYNQSYLPGFPRLDGECCVKQYASPNATAPSGVTEARGTYRWNPVCERLETNTIYKYQGRHRLDQFSACFTAADSGAASSWQGQLVSPPACVSVAVLRCTKPTVRVINVTGHTRRNGTSYVIPVATGVLFSLEAGDDNQTRVLTIRHRAEPGIPSTGAMWHPPVCKAYPSLLIGCNPLARNFSFAAGLEHAGTRYPVCFEATNDQVECPAFRNDATPAPYGVYTGPGVWVSQASQPHCVVLDVPGPEIRWAPPTPAEEATLTTYMGCLFSITLIAEDSTNYFDLDIIPFTVEFGLPNGVVVEERRCSFIRGATPPMVAQGVGSCPVASRLVRWSPARAQTGLLSRVCFNAAAQSTHVAVRCFSVLVSKCRYCAQRGESLQAIAESFGTDWLQIWGANAHMRNPHKLAQFELVNLGALYPASAGDSLASLAKRFGSDVASIMSVNPDFTSENQELSAGQPVCVLPGICRSAEYRPPRQ